MVEGIEKLGLMLFLMQLSECLELVCDFKNGNELRKLYLYKFYFNIKLN